MAEAMSEAENSLKSIVKRKRSSKGQGVASWQKPSYHNFPFHRLNLPFLLTSGRGMLCFSSNSAQSLIAPSLTP